MSLDAFTIYIHALSARYTGILAARHGVHCTADDVIEAVSGYGAAAVSSLEIREVGSVLRL